MNKLKNVSAAGPLLLLLTLIIYNTQGVADIWVHIPFWLGVALTILLLILYFDQVKASLRLRSTQYGANSFVMVLLVVGILGMVNFLAKKYNERWDLTSAKLYSLSDQTEKLMTRLRQVTTLTKGKMERTRPELSFLRFCYAMLYICSV